MWISFGGTNLGIYWEKKSISKNHYRKGIYVSAVCYIHRKSIPVVLSKSLLIVLVTYSLF